MAWPRRSYRPHGKSLRYKVQSKTFLELRAEMEGNTVHDIRANVHRDLREHFERRFDAFSAAFARGINRAWTEITRATK